MMMMILIIKTAGRQDPLGSRARKRCLQLHFVNSAPTAVTFAKHCFCLLDLNMATFNQEIVVCWSCNQGGITCEAIDEPRKSSYAIDERVIINFRDKNVVIARFRDKNGGFILFIYIYVLSIAFLFFR